MTRRIAIVGAGMAGTSLAALLAGEDSVVLLEAEAHPGFHATGRSAAFWSETYGGPGVQPLTSASGPFLHKPPAEFGGESFLGERGELMIAPAGDGGAIDAFEARFAGAGVAMTREDAAARVPGLRGEWQGLWMPSCADIDVARLHGAFLARARRLGAELRCDSALVEARRVGGAWQLRLADGETLAADVLVNAAGAWADRVAQIAGAAPVGIQPYRRTMVQLRVDPPAPATLPLVMDAAGGFYFKPEPGGRVWLTPHDETPAAPGDVAAEEIDVAVAIDRMQRVVDWRVEAVERRWAGLRSFAPDRLPVYGWDPAVEGLFWCAGQGGFGIQTAPAGAALCAALFGRGGVPTSVDAALYRPGRFG
ncbi:FAD-binding oxidoreductase [Sphingomonas sp. PL-96]|uniref:NAD(P)/FAD-dependent oxidoreductase n=1 Tax=Sphingomonas sp. PL-96 TaxID=2887201 RepID=UPI001E4CC72A|nr:FAD-dependent oxidoreductase [Sphingomonas sp. PL-96]MCC2976882.1 FAD-binding oxidoreductase [Sphingomonas sp. PL-96]